jgi:hypothetical protein
LKTSPLIWSAEAGYFLQVGGKNGRPTLRLDINQLALTPDGLNYLQGMLNGIFDLPWPWWGYARVSRIDIAVDLWGVEIADWVWDVPKRPAREAICRQRQVRTIYLGAKKSSPLVVYNKAKQDPAYAGGQALTRVEYRLKNLGTVDTLTTLPNPFVGLDVFDPRKLSLPLPDPLKHALMSVGHLHGWHGILNVFPKAMRLALEKAYEKTCAGWWDPTAVWNGWGQHLAETMPSIYAPGGKKYDDAVVCEQAVEAQVDAAAISQIPLPAPTYVPALMVD